MLTRHPNYLRPVVDCICDRVHRDLMPSDEVATKIDPFHRVQLGIEGGDLTDVVADSYK